MNATKILLGQVLLVCFVVVALVWMATEWTARRIGFQSQLGQPWFELIGWPVDQPPAFFWRWFSFDAYAPHVFDEGGYIAVFGGIAAITVAATEVVTVCKVHLSECVSVRQWEGVRHVVGDSSI